MSTRAESHKYFMKNGHHHPEALKQADAHLHATIKYMEEVRKIPQGYFPEKEEEKEEKEEEKEEKKEEEKKEEEKKEDAK